jgi:hypothetical protein
VKTKLDRVALLERVESDSTLTDRIEHSYWMEVLYLHPPQQDPINEALAYRRPFPEWTSERFVKLVGADPAVRHPFAACKGFWKLIPHEGYGRKRGESEARYLADAEAWRDEMIASGHHDLAGMFWRVLTFSDTGYEALGI